MTYTNGKKIKKGDRVRLPDGSGQHEVVEIRETDVMVWIKDAGEWAYSPSDLTFVKRKPRKRV